MTALLVIYVIGAIVVGRDTYGKPGQKRPKRDIQPGNPRTATAVGVLFGLLWPPVFAIFLCCSLQEWFAAGQRW